jgi:arginase
MTVNQFLLSPFFLDSRADGLESLAQRNWIVNAPTVASGDRDARMSMIHEDIAQHVDRSLRRGLRPVSLAGDCCAAVGVVAGLQRAGVDPVLIWLDAHGDFNTPETTLSGFLGGMPLAMIVGRGDQTLVDAVGTRPLDEADVILADARDLDPRERELLDHSRVQRVPRLEDLLDLLPADRPLWVHFDPDVIDARDAPAMLYPVVGGPDVNAARGVARRLAATGRVVAVSFTVWQMDVDSSRQTEHACLDTLGDLIGEPIRGSASNTARPGLDARART